MLSPYAIHHLLRHFNAIDRAVTRQMVYPRPKDEEQLTGTLIDLLDEQVQVQERVEYGIADLRRDLAEVSEPIGVSFAVETHKYSKEFEGRVSQADLGLIVVYENNFEPHLSGKRSWLLQAKRVYPTSLNPTRYEPKASFGAVKLGQEQRIRDLVKFVGVDFFRYLQYCPRPETLDEASRLELSYFRGKALANQIFDFSYGLEMRDDIRSGSATVAAGVFVSSIDQAPKSLGSVHASIFHGTTPLSWFLIQHIPSVDRHSWQSSSLLEDHEDHELVAKIVRGESDVVNEICDALSDKRWTGQLLPAATLTVTITAGARNMRDRYRWERQ
ncbi:MAG: hypothetical protein IE913_04595 [Halothiobacillus sp.]|nr:hypothetical protein [Halothiobacillus sp.]